ncbi:MAG: bifunctional methylenetetrahydrofolate dehydrogenase/methenyltetrahydrofolate cyclohydrolase FolD [Spirochaetia bacterium]|nr:bifunctional methylenetetrahydrofolate dehydrogenase/methenyltetrahydrofolate cyclohydrolase FolD [Spirochaetia bacterium]
MILLTGKEVATSVYKEIEEQMSLFTTHPPTLAVILVGNDPASLAYVSSKKKMAESLNFGHKDIFFKEDISEEQIIHTIKELNEDEEVDGILVQLPLPKGIDESNIINAIDPDKDVDGLHPVNIGKILREEDGFIPCTPFGIIKMLEYYNIEVSGKHVVVIGRSVLVGKSIALLLVQKHTDATVTITHSKTKDLSSITKQADIIIAAVGKPHMVTRDMVKNGAVVIDVGINRVEDKTKIKGYRLTGDVDFDAVSPICEAITPVPRGVGVMTIAMLMYNTYKAALKRIRK